MNVSPDALDLILSPSLLQVCMHECPVEKGTVLLFVTRAKLILEKA